MSSVLHRAASFPHLVWSNLAAQSAEQIALAAAPLVAVTALGAGAAETSVLQVALTLPFIMFAVPAGLMADRFSRRMLMVGAETLRTIALLAILLLLVAGQLSWPALAVLGFVAACGTVVFSVAAPSIVPALVPASDLSGANARIELARTTAFAAGPALGGALVGWSGGGAAFAFATALSLAAVLFLAKLDEPSRAPAPPRHPLAEIRDGIAFVRGHAVLLPVFITQIVFNIAFFLILAVFVPYAVRHLGLSESAVGLVLAMLGVGMVAGALLAPVVLDRLPFG
ncbi:MAG TPA: MFS transporter, partial [Alphaproteobacteria bacterium]|nr:MFS transporter [Alphaproteobacteria bacterium]